mgnify:FL=1
MNARKCLTMAVVGTIAALRLASPVCAAAEENEKEKTGALDQYDIGDMLVTAHRDSGEAFVAREGTVGILGTQDTMKTPFTVTNITEKTVESFSNPTQPLDSLLAGSPAIRQSGSILHNDFTFRGFRANGTSCYVNGIPGIWTQFNAPTHIVARAEVVAGPNSGLSGTGTHYESDAAGGLVNFVTKRAGEKDFSRFTLSHSGHNLFGGYLDFSYRFGRNRDWGARVNIEKVDGETAVDGQRVKSSSVYVNLDHRDDRSKTNIFTGYRENEIINGQRWFKLANAVTRFPSVPDHSRNYSFNGMDKATYGWVLAINHEQKFNDDWKWFMNFGLLHNKLNKNVMYEYSALTILNDNGDFNINEQSSTTPQKAYYWQAGIHGKVTLGDVVNNLTLAVDRAWRLRDGTKSFATYHLGTGNIYTGILNQIAPAYSGYESYLSNKTRIAGISFVDSIDYKKLNVILGIHYHKANVDSYSAATGKVSSSSNSSATCPTYAVMYSPTENFAAYMSHAENFNAGTVVGTGYANTGDILPPAKTKQNEIGFKYNNKGLLATLSFFDIEQANNIEVMRGALRYSLQDGRLRHKGVELGVSGPIGDKWNFSTGISYLDAKYDKTARGRYDGIIESGRPKWAGSLMLRYDADESFGAFGRVVYTGSAPVLYEKFWAPSYAVVDLGVEYKTKINNLPAKFSLTCYNVFDKSYWMIARGDNLYLSTPRTLALTMSVDF